MESKTKPAGRPKAAGKYAITPEEREAAMRDMLAEENFPLAILGGGTGALIGAGLWAAITVFTEVQIGWMAVGVGFLAGCGTRLLGKGVSGAFGVVGAVCALIGCLLGNLFTVCYFVAQGAETDFSEVLAVLLSDPSALLSVMAQTFSVIDLLFYGIAVYEGYRFSLRQLDESRLVAGKLAQRRAEGS